MPTFKCAGTQRFDDDGEPLCDYQDTVRWLGRCPGCGRFADHIKVDTDAARRARATRKFATLAEAPTIEQRPRVRTGIDIFDTLTNGGIPEGDLVVLSGEGGSGKSTLVLGLAEGAALHHRRKRSLYLSSEEPKDALLEIAQRCGLSSETVTVGGIVDDIDEIIAFAADFRPALLAVDSIHECTIGGIKAGSSGEALMDVTRKLREMCKREKIACIANAHMTRAGEIRAPTTLDHYVDAMLELDVKHKTGRQGEIDETTRGYRKLTLAVKSRIGPGGSYYFNLTREGVITPLDEDTYFGRKKPRDEEDDDNGNDDPPPRKRNLRLVELAEKYGG